MQRIIKKIFERKELIYKPPVLIDIGASEKVHNKWKSFSKYSICVAFDADERDFRFIEKENKKFKKLYVFNCIVSDKVTEYSDFYLTKSPYCSSILEPLEQDKIKSLLFSPLFKVENIKKIKTITLNEVLDELKLSNIDWFKSDSQGTDLRLFRSLDEQIQNNIITAEFEPGFINLYKNEDMLYSLLEFMNRKNFWLSGFIPKGTPRISANDLSSIFRNKLAYRLLKESINISPCWAEITFINNFDSNNNFGTREFLLGWLFSTIENHHSFALIIAKKGCELFKEDIFHELKNFSASKIKFEVLKFKFLPSVYKFIQKKIKIN